MEKRGFFIVAMLLTLSATCQDYIITWKNDTLPCQLPANPRKEGLRPVGRFTQGYYRVAAFFPNDSIRSYNAGEIKGYYRQKHGKGLLCDGHFEAFQLEEATSPLVTADDRRTFTWAFLLRVEEGPYASLYKLLEWGSRLNTYYYVVKKTGEKAGIAQLLSTTKRRQEILFDADIREEMEKAYSRKMPLSALLRLYNELKTKANNKVQ